MNEVSPFNVVLQLVYTGKNHILRLNKPKNDGDQIILLFFFPHDSKPAINWFCTCSLQHVLPNYCNFIFANTTDRPLTTLIISCTFLLVPIWTSCRPFSQSFHPVQNPIAFSSSFFLYGGHYFFLLYFKAINFSHCTLGLTCSSQSILNNSLVPFECYHIWSRLNLCFYRSSGALSTQRSFIVNNWLSNGVDIFFFVIVSKIWVLSYILKGFSRVITSWPESFSMLWEILEAFCKTLDKCFLETLQRGQLQLL